MEFFIGGEEEQVFFDLPSMLKKLEIPQILLYVYHSDGFVFVTSPNPNHRYYPSFTGTSEMVASAHTTHPPRKKRHYSLHALSRDGGIYMKNYGGVFVLTYWFELLVDEESRDIVGDELNVEMEEIIENPFARFPEIECIDAHHSNPHIAKFRTKDGKIVKARFWIKINPSVRESYEKPADERRGRTCH